MCDLTFHPRTLCTFPPEDGFHVMECGKVISYYHEYEFRAGVHETRIWSMHLTSFVHAFYMFHVCISLLAHKCNRSRFDLIGGTVLE